MGDWGWGVDPRMGRRIWREGRRMRWRGEGHVWEGRWCRGTRRRGKRRRRRGRGREGAHLRDGVGVEVRATFLVGHVATVAETFVEVDGQGGQFGGTSRRLGATKNRRGEDDGKLNREGVQRRMVALPTGRRALDGHLYGPLFKPGIPPNNALLFWSSAKIWANSIVLCTAQPMCALARPLLVRVYNTSFPRVPCLYWDQYHRRKNKILPSLAVTNAVPLQYDFQELPKETQFSAHGVTYDSFF
jgi:hypothetical protein